MTRQDAAPLPPASPSSARACPAWACGLDPAVDHPVLAAGLKEHIPALQPLAVELDHDLAVAPLDRVVGAGVPDHHLAAAVLAFGDLARELEVFERVVLDVHCEVVLLGVRRD